jgi:hypothetical protein
LVVPTDPHEWLFCQMPMMVYAAKTIVALPVSTSQAKAALPPDLDEVVEESHPGHAHQEEEQKERGPRG